MIIGVPKEIKDNEYRVSMTPAGADLLVRAGHRVLVEQGAGSGSGFADAEYAQAGAEIEPQAARVWGQAEMVAKVKEPLPQEYAYLREGLLLFTYLHLAADRGLTEELLRRKVTAVAYETVQRSDGSLPLLTPMSQIAGRMAAQVAATYLQRTNGGLGKLMGGVPGVRPADVVIIGGGTVGTNAAQIALGMGAQVTVVDVVADRLRYLNEVLHGNLVTLSSNPRNVAEAVARADAVIGAVLTPGAKAPRLVTGTMVATMRPGSVIVDVAVDQGGCVETSRPTSHSEPTFLVNGVVHYCVPNIPGVVPWTSTYALSNATLPYARRLADQGFAAAVRSDPVLALGVNAYQGHLTYRAVADAFGMEYAPLATLL
ncbi:MAG TPA: alanine dehydrogenase [Anaerolineae bacterium]|nr:alanine dehydrogenase [Anaerolineae bacterium]HOQ99138.1 alanine dehydrogenase [Anaerolineae bacterium]HPL27277.1 alanine dehydrogenase [Anaerolineae bacterium]